jgi:amino acid adenylation domain-containing protein
MKRGIEGQAELILQIQRQVELTPDAVAVADGRMELTYSELNERSNRLARHLKGRGAGNETPVALIMERSAQMLVTILACFKAGAAYLPIDPNYPEQRIRMIVGESGAVVVVSDEQDRWGITGAVRWVWLEREREAIGRQPASNLPVSTDASNLAYVIYTSGSTGQPKGVMIERRGMINHLYAKIEELGLSGEDRIAQTACQCFDISVWQFLAGLMVGGRIEIVRSEYARDPVKLLEQVETRGVSVLETVPAMLRGMIESLEEGDAGDAELKRLRWLVVTGEALSAELCRRWLRLREKTKLINAYGPTECSDDVTHYVMSRAPEEGEVEAPIGRPLLNTRIYIVDVRNELAPAGAIGEICVGGEGVGRGYKNEAGKTAEVFIPDRFSGERGSRIYRTGDLGRWREDGNVEYLGRIDEQVKVRGYRVELGEIEAALEKHPAVKESVVVAKGESGREKTLVCYVVMKEAAGVGQLRHFLMERLPEYMAPSAYMKLEKMPLTSNGKVDKSALPSPDLSETGGPGAMEDETLFLAPRTSVEEALVEIWQEVLGKRRIGVEDDFFDLGGYSLLATQVTSRLKKRFQLEVPLSAMFEARTVARLAEFVEALIIEEIERMDEQEAELAI